MVLLLFVIAFILGIIFFEISSIKKRLARLEQKPPVPVASAIEFYELINGQLTKVDDMVFKVTDEQKKASIKIKDAKGNDAQVDGLPAWSVSDPALVSMEVSPDGMSAILKPVGPIGACKLQVSADADLGAGVTSILGEADMEFVAGDAVSVEIAFE